MCDITVFTIDELKQIKKAINASIAQNLLMNDGFKNNRLNKDYKLLKRVIDEITKIKEGEDD